MLIRRGLFSFLATLIASSPDSYQSTGLSACSRRYGLDADDNLLCLPALVHAAKSTINDMEIRYFTFPDF